jgi:ankyrin repeat protein
MTVNNFTTNVACSPILTSHQIHRTHPIRYAAAGGHDVVVDFLISKGADVNALHSNGGSALMEAATAGE